MYTDYTQVSIYMLLFPTRCSTLLDCWNIMKTEGARKAPPKPCKHWMAEQQVPEVFSTVFGSTISYSHILRQQKRDGLQLQALSMPIQLSGELLEQFKALFPVLPAHGISWAGHSILREPGWAKACSWRTWNEQFKTNSFRMASSKFIHTLLHRHTSLRETFMYM